MCRNIKVLFHFDPPTTDEEIRNASLQFVRKLSGFNQPSKDNEAVFDQAVAVISADVKKLLVSLRSDAKFRNREIEAARAREKSAKRFRKEINTNIF